MPLFLMKFKDSLPSKRDEQFINNSRDSLLDVKRASEDSLAEVWDNPEDEVWNEYLKETL